jgi:hypothetical protein
MVSAANLKYYLSGGSSNADPTAALGGAISSHEVGSAIDNIFADVDSAQALAGSTKYRCIYFKNTDSDATGLYNPYLWINQVMSGADAIAIGLDAGGKNATAVTIANENTAPAGVSFTAPTTKAGGLALPTSPYVQNDYIAIWIRRVVPSSCASSANDNGSIRIEGDGA